MSTRNEKLDAAKKYLGTNWVLHHQSTYSHKRRLPGMCLTLHPIVAKAVKEGRL